MFEDVIARFESDSDLGVRRVVAEARLWLAFIADGSGDHEQAWKRCDDVLADVGEAQDSRLRVVGARAYMQRAQSLQALARSDEAAETYRELVRRFGEDNDPDEPTIPQDVALAKARLAGLTSATAATPRRNHRWTSPVRRTGTSPAVRCSMCAEGAGARELPPTPE